MTSINRQYNLNSTQQDNADCIPKALWDQLPPHVKSAISSSQCHNKQQANCTTAHSNDHTNHSAIDTLPTYTSNSVHHMPTDRSPTSDNKILNSVMSSSSSTTSNTCSINMQSGDCLVHSNGRSYTVNMTHVTYQCSQDISDSIGSLIDEEANGGLAGTDVCLLDYTE